MKTRKQVLVTSKSDGTIELVPMRYNASHQRGWRCFIGSFANNPATIAEDTAPSFQGRSLFDALAMYRMAIEPAGSRLLHAIASQDCWADSESRDRFCRRMSWGSPTTELVDGFLPIGPEDAVTLDEQRGYYQAWQASLPSAAELQSAPQSRAALALEHSNAAIIARREAAILARGDLARDEP